MAKISVIQRNKKRRKMVQSLSNKRQQLKSMIYNKKLPLDERFAVIAALAAMPRNSVRCRIRNRCELTGRPRGYYRKFSLSRNMIRVFAGKGAIPGLTKASW